MVKPLSSLYLKAAHYAEENPGMPQAHLATMLAPLERTGGFVFGVFGCLGDQESADLFVQTVQHHLERLATTLEAGINLTHRFEQLLQAINESLAQTVEEGSLHLSITETSSIIGVADAHEVIVSGFGQLAAQFLHKTDKEQFEQYDLSRSMRVEDEIPTWQKPFLTVLNGDLHPGDVFYLGSRVNRHDLSPIAFNEILTTLPPTSAVNKIRQHLPLETTFGSVILRAERVEERGFSDQGVTQSLTELDRTTERTEHYLADQSAEVRSWMTKVWLIFFPKRGATTRAKMLRRSLRLIGRLLVTFAVISFAIVHDLGRLTIKNVMEAVRHPQLALVAILRLRHKTDTHIRKSIAHFNQLPKTSKRILLLALIILCLFIGSLVVINRQQAKEAERRAYATSIHAVESKLETAEASLIYGDEVQAHAFLNEASELIPTLDVSTQMRQAKATELTKRVSDFENRLAHVNNVTPTTVARSAQEIFGEQVTPHTLGLTREGVDVAVYNGKAYLLAPKLNQIFKHNHTGDTFDGGAAWILSNTTNIGDATAITIDGFIWVLKGDGAIVKYLSGREEPFKAAVVDPPLLNATELWTDDASPYLYVVDPNKKRIVVFKKESGDLVVQYTSPAFEFLQRVKADEANHTIYVEAGTTVYQFTSE